MEGCRDLALAAACQCTPTKRWSCRSWRKKAKKKHSYRKAPFRLPARRRTKHFPSVGRLTTTLNRNPRDPQAPPHSTKHQTRNTRWLLCRPLCPSCRPSRPHPWEAPSLAHSVSSSRTPTPSTSGLLMVLPSSPLLLLRVPPSPTAALSLSQSPQLQPPPPATSARARQSLWRLHRLQLHLLRLRRSSLEPSLPPARREEACDPGPTCASTKVSSTSALTGATS